MKVYYIFDSYCGWCYGFETILKPFIEAHPELEVTVLSGGLFLDGHSLSAFPYMSDTNKRIADMFGVEFGKPYLNLLETGSMVPDSNDAAIGFGVLRNFLPKGEHVNLASKMHEAFYLDGKSLSDVETIKSIAKSYDLPADKIAEEFIRISEEGKYHPDFYEARKIGVTSFPTLFLEINGKYYDLKANYIKFKQFFMKQFENIKRLDFLVSFELIFENVNIGLNLGMTKRTFKMRFFKSSDALAALVLS